MSIAKSNAEAEKYKAMSLIAGSGSDAAKVAAVMSMALGNQGQSQGSQLQAPKSAGDTALQWLGLIVPSVVQGYSIHSNALMSIRQSDNNARIAKSTNNAFVGIAGKIQAPLAFAPTVITPVVPQANVTTTTTSTDNHSITGSYNPSSVATTTTNTNSGNTTTTPTTDSYNVIPTP